MLSPDQRIAGVLVPVFALRGSHDLGIGDTRALREFATWSAEQGLKVVQILPVNESGSDNSPYNIVSSIALDPITIATLPEEMEDLTKRAFRKITADFDLDAMRSGPVPYARVRVLKTRLLEAAYIQFCEKADGARVQEFQDFCDEHASWLEPYALYRALKTSHGESEVFSLWLPEQQSLVAATAWRETLEGDAKDEIEGLENFHRYVQWIAVTQWQAVREHCRKLGVALMGDIPVGVSIYSCDVWSEPEQFDLTRSCGAPPEKVFASDPFTEKWGQNWGFPLYDWFAMSKDNFAWWRRRLRTIRSMFDLVRVDHALGFFRIYSFPWRPEQNGQFLDLTEEQAKEFTGGRLPGFIPCDDTTPENEERNLRHGEVLFRMMLEEIGEHRLIAEDLGTVPPYVRPALARMEIPGFKIPQWERLHDGGPMTPGRDYPRISLATYATHDHPPVHTFWNAWVEQAASPKETLAAGARHEMREFLDFAGATNIEPHAFDDEILAATMRGLMATNSWLAVPMITDILGTTDRFNFPGAIGDQNWTARLEVPISELNVTFAPQLTVLRQILAQTARNCD